MKRFGYIRVSTGGQDGQSQKLAIMEYAQKEGFIIDEFIEIQKSSQKSLQERQIDSLLQRLKSGDLVIASELSRIARSVGQVIRIVDELVKKKVNFIALKENIHILNGKKDMQSTLTVTMFGLFAEIERNLISERTKQGLEAAKRKGKLLGRPKGPGKSKLNGKENEIEMLLEKKVSKSSIAKIMNVSRTTMCHFIKSRSLESAMDNPKTILKKLDVILDNYLDMGASEKLDTFKRMKNLCKNLEKIAKKENKNYGYTSEKLAAFTNHVGAIAGVEHDNGHPVKQHLSWAYGELISLGSSLCFDTK